LGLDKIDSFGGAGHETCPACFAFAFELRYNSIKEAQMQYDLTRPNSGRAIDYWLGGSHNFEIDRQLAQQAEKITLTREAAVTGRAFTGRSVRYFCSHGIRVVFDFGAALPTCDNTHLVAHKIDPAIKVIYSDVDPVTVAYAQDILDATPNVIYLEANAATPRSILDAPATLKLIGDERQVGLVFHSLVHLLDDGQLRSATQVLYEWAAPGSYLSLSTLGGPSWSTNENLIAAGAVYARAGIQGHFRLAEETLALVSPWQVTAEGIADNFDWGLGTPSNLPYVFGYSMMLRK
jgi:hypothetical protein